MRLTRGDGYTEHVHQACIVQTSRYHFKASKMDPTTATLIEAQSGISSRFESQTAIDDAKAVREKEWKEAYAR